MIAMRIGSNISGINFVTLNNLMKVTKSMAQITQQLSTGSLLSNGSYNPSGLIAAEQIRSELSAIAAANNNAADAYNIINLADSAMSQVGGLLRTIQSNVVESAGGSLSDAEKQAKQIEIDAAIQAINTIGANTSLGGQKLLSGGSIDFNFSPNPNSTTPLTLPDINSGSLGGTAGTLADLASGGSANVMSGDLSKADEIVKAAETQVAQDQARLGAFDKYVVDSSRELLDVMQISLSSSLSQIADADIAQSMSSLIREEILAKAIIKSLVIANNNQGAVLQLLSASSDHV
jgi:flagellin